MIGLKRGKDILAEHEHSWSEIATQTIESLKSILNGKYFFHVATTKKIQELITYML